MKRIFLPVAWLFLAVLMFASCLGDNNDTSVSSRETAITSFALGTVNRYVHTTSSVGTDSIYKVAYAGSAYKFHIDHVNRTIYNPDSLPYGTDAAHIICTILAYNSAAIGIKSITSDSLRAYSSADSIDFRSPRLFRVVSLDGTAWRDYTVKVNVHQESGDEFGWEQKNTPDWLSGMKSLKAMPCGDRLFVFGSQDGSTGVILSTPLSDGDNWTYAAPNLNQPLPADIHENVAVKHDVIYMKWDGKLMRSSDGSTWEVVGPANFSKLLGASQEQLFALGYDGLLYASSDDGLTWDLESLDDDVTLLPSQDISIISTPLVTDGAMERVILLGNRDVSVYPDDNKSVIWVKIQDPAKKTGQWMLVGNAYPAYELPRLNHLAVVPYADGLMALGAEGLGACANEAFSQFYLSNDLGLTWEDDSRLLFPTGFRSGSIFAMTVDTDHYIWLLCTESGQVWRGRLNEEGWEDVEKAITE